MRTVTPRLKVSDNGIDMSPLMAHTIMEDGGVVIVATDDSARVVLRNLGLRECCVEDRISVSHGGPILCKH